jgi:hypothetical protein
VRDRLVRVWSAGRCGALPPRQLEHQAKQLGFANLQAFCDAGYGVLRMAQKLDTSQWQVSQALGELGVRLQPRRQRLAQQRQQAAEVRVAARVAELGFADVEAYLVDRVGERGWLVSAVTAELGVAPVTVRRLPERHDVKRSQRTAPELAASAHGRRVQTRGWAARLAELGFGDLASYLPVRVGQGWSVRRMRAELGVGKAWLVGEMGWLGIKQ